ncbi:unnamed protein product [Ectocarpus sp. 13 AM-2016]
MRCRPHPAGAGKTRCAADTHPIAKPANRWVEHFSLGHTQDYYRRCVGEHSLRSQRSDFLQARPNDETERNTRCTHLTNETTVGQGWCPQVDERSHRPGNKSCR